MIISSFERNTIILSVKMPFLSMIIYAKNEYCKKISLTEIQKPRQILNVGAFVSMIIAMITALTAAITACTAAYIFTVFFGTYEIYYIQYDYSKDNSGYYYCRGVLIYKFNQDFPSPLKNVIPNAVRNLQKLLHCCCFLRIGTDFLEGRKSI